jgi:hypothetical protein
MLTFLHAREIRVGSIVCDGSSDQLKVLDFSDRSSIHAKNPGNCLFTCLLFIPCLCHILDNAYHHLVRESPALKQIIDSLHAIARFCHKPTPRRTIGAPCPEFINTRWVYNHRILTFVIDHAADIDELPGTPCLVTAALLECQPLLLLILFE